LQLGYCKELFAKAKRRAYRYLFCGSLNISLLMARVFDSVDSIELLAGIATFYYGQYKEKYIYSVNEICKLK